MPRVLFYRECLICLYCRCRLSRTCKVFRW